MPRVSPASVAVQELELETTGSFEVGPSADDSCRCGKLTNPRVLQFKVVVTSCPAFLDESGFIVDWQVIHKYFAERWAEPGPAFPSCERIALHALQDIVRLIDGKCLAVSVVIGSGAVPSGMTARWRRDAETARQVGAFAD